ncbi:hypothetical protein ACHAXM_011961 [Skeletonema potamos]|jgi:hypothetical protein
MPSSSKNPFDDDYANIESSGGGGGWKVVVNHCNPSEEGSRKATPTDSNPFDNDDCSGFIKTNQSERKVCPDDAPASPIIDEYYGHFEPLSPKERSDILHLELDMLAHQRSHRVESFTSSSNQESIDGRATAWTPTTNLPLGDSSHSQLLSNQPPTGTNPFENSSDELECAISVNNETETTQKSKSSRVSIGNNLFNNASGDSLESSGIERNSNTKGSERVSSAAVTDRIDSSSGSSNNRINSVRRDNCDESDSTPDDNSLGDEEAQVLHQTTRENDEESVASDAKSQAGDDRCNKSDVNDAENANYTNDDDEIVRQDLQQSKLFLDEQVETSNSLPDKTKEEETTTPLLQNGESVYWNKEGITDAVASFDARCEIKQDVENPVDESLPREPEVMRSSIRRKKVKNRHCKACVMVTVVWGASVILISIALGMDWLGVNIDGTSNSEESLCTLCAGNSWIGFNNVSVYTLQPTRKPSFFTVVATIKPPPENIAEVCAPSIFLDYGPTKIPSVENLVASCATACLPAACCIVDNNQAKQALITMLESQGMGVQAATLFSTIEGCNRGDNVAICDSYHDFCSTLYDMKHALNTLPKNWLESCNKAAESPSIATAFSRQHDAKRMSGECNDVCLPLACCYETSEPSFATETKRKRQHSVDYTHVIRRTTEFEQIGESGCGSFNAPIGSLNAEICSAYFPFCSSEDLNETADLIPITFMPTSTNQPSTQPTQTILSPTTLVGSSEPSLMPSSTTVESPSSHPTISSSQYSVNSTSYPSHTPSLAPTLENMTKLEPLMPNNTQPSLPPTLMLTAYNTSSAVTHLPTMSSYPTSNSSSTTNTSKPSIFDMNTSKIDSAPSQHPTISSQPTRDVNETQNSSFPSMMPSEKDRTSTETSSTM